MIVKYSRRFGESSNVECPHLLEVEGVLCHPERVCHVGLDPLHALDTLLAGDVARVLSGVTHAPCQADVLRPVHEEVVDDHEQHRNLDIDIVDIVDVVDLWIL